MSLTHRGHVEVLLTVPALEVLLTRLRIVRFHGNADQSFTAVVAGFGGMVVAFEGLNFGICAKGGVYVVKDIVHAEGVASLAGFLEFALVWGENPLSVWVGIEREVGFVGGWVDVLVAEG